MVDKELLEAISQMMDAKVAEQEKRLDAKLEAQRRETFHDMKVLLDTEVTTKFNLLAEGQEEILRRMPSEEDMDIVDGRLDVLEATVKKLSREVEELKKAN